MNPPSIQRKLPAHTSSVCLQKRRVVWSETTTRAFGDGFVKDMGRLSYADAKRLAARYGGAFIVQ